MPQNRFIRARRSRNYGGIGRKCIQSNLLYVLLKRNKNNCKKTVKDTLEQLNQAKELQQKIIQKELERKQSNSHDYAPTIEKKRNFFFLQSKIEQIYPYWQNYQTAKKGFYRKTYSLSNCATNIWTSTIVSKATGRTARECFEAKGTNGSAENPS